MYFFRRGSIPPLQVILMPTLFYVLFFVCIVAVSPEGVITLNDGDEYNLSLQEYSVKNTSGEVIGNITNILPQSVITINVVSVPVYARFIIVQAHSYQYDVILSYDRVLKPHYYIRGTNLGLVQEIQNNQHNVQFYLYNPSDVNATVLITVQAYDDKAPIPGGCNMEFSVETAPYLILDYTPSTVIVNNQAASAPVSRGEPPKCEKQAVSYEVYHMYLPETDFSEKAYFSGIMMMNKVSNIEQNGKKVSDPVQGSVMRHIFSAYPGTGSVYAIIARSGNSSSAYVPAFTYSCETLHLRDMSTPNSTHYWGNTCDVLSNDTVFSKVLCAVIFFLGLFVCLRGHQFFKTEMFLLGFLSGGLVSYILIALLSTFNGSEITVLTVISGIGFGAVWLALWWFFGVPVYSVLLSTMTLGFIFAGVASYAWIGDVDALRNDVNYWLVFGCIILSVPILLSSVIHRANMISCAVLGAYAVIIPIDHYIGSNLKYIMVNIVRRATVKDFRYAIVDPPFQTKDIVLCVIWIILAVIGNTVQWRKQRGKPPFPPPPYLRYRERSQQTRQLQRFNPTERTPLLVEASELPNPIPYDPYVMRSPDPPSPQPYPRYLSFLKLARPQL